MSITKQCSKCKRILDYSEFHKNRTAKDGLDVRCKECASKYQKEKREMLKWETMMAFGGRCTHIDENGIRCDKNVFTDLKELHLTHPHDNGNDHRNLISNGQRGRDFYKALKKRNWNTDGFIVEIMCSSHHSSFDIRGKKNHNYKDGKHNNPTWLEQKYKTMTQQEIGDLCGVSGRTISDRMEKFNQPRRPRGKRP